MNETRPNSIGALLRLLGEISDVAFTLRADAIRELTSEAQAICTHLLEAERVTSLPGRAATVLESPAPQSSVQIEGRAKGPPAITVKTYADRTGNAAEIAQREFDRLVARYAALRETP